MAIQIIEENRKPNFSEKLNMSMKKGSEMLSQHQENQALKERYGLDLTGISDPTTRQQVLLNELKYGRQSRGASQTPGALQGARESMGETQKYSDKLIGATGRVIGEQYQQQEQPIEQRPGIPGIESNPASTSMRKQSKGKESVDDMAKQYVLEMRPDLLNPASEFGAIATFDAPNKMDIRPEEEERIRSNLNSKGVLPEVQNQVINTVRNDLQTRYKEALNKYGFDQDRMNQNQVKWQNFVQNSPERLSPFIDQKFPEMPHTQDLLKNRYFQYAGALSSTMTPQQMHAEAKAKLDPLLNKVDALHTIPAMPPIRSSSDVSEYLNPVKDAYKDLVDQGLIEIAKEDAFINKDMGNEEFHSAVWGDQTSKHTLNSLHSIKAPQEYPGSTSGIPHEMARYNKAYPKERERYVNDLSKTLKGISATDDLILLRAMVLDNGGSIKDFTEALDKAQNQGLKLSAFQKSQIQELQVPRRPPLWEIFSGAGETDSLGKGSFGLSGTLNWKPFINYIRGKK